MNNDSLNTPDLNKQNQDKSIKTEKQGDLPGGINKETLSQEINEKEQSLVVIDEPDLKIINHKLVASGIWLFEVVKNDEKKGLSLKGFYWAGMRELIQNAGYYKRYLISDNYTLIKDTNNVIEEVKACHIKDEIYSYIASDKSDYQIKYDGASCFLSFTEREEIFIKQNNLFFCDGYLGLLDNHKKKILRDSKDTIRFFFSNEIVEIYTSTFKVKSYYDLDGTCIWKGQIIQNNFHYNSEFTSGVFAKFISNVAGGKEDRILSFETAIGYLVHNLQILGKGQIILLYDEMITDSDTPQGGSGKGVLIQALSQSRKVCLIDGKKFKGKGQFDFQRVTPETQIIAIDDVHPKFEIDRLNSISTDGMVVERKYGHEFRFEYEESPKLLITSNTVLATEGSTRKRRQFILEFSNHYSQHIVNGTEEPIENEHGGKFFSDDWSGQEWDRFFSYMIYCAKQYLKFGLKSYEAKNVSHNRFKQTVSADFYDWVFNQEFDLNFDYDTKDWFEDFIGYANTAENYSQRQFTISLKKYATLILGWEHNTKSKNNQQYFFFSSG